MKYYQKAKNPELNLTHDSDLTRLSFDQVPEELVHVAYKQRSLKRRAAEHRKAAAGKWPQGPIPEG
jgi:hypothetical protein